MHIIESAKESETPFPLLPYCTEGRRAAAHCENKAQAGKEERERKQEEVLSKLQQNSKTKKSEKIV